MNEPKRKKLMSRWSGKVARYAERQIVDEQSGESITETAWLEKRKHQPGWRNGARVRK